MREFSHLGDYLKKQRVGKKLTQAELAKKLKVHNQFVSNWERGLCAPPGNSLPKLIHLLQINREKLVEVMLKDSKIVIENKVYLSTHARKSSL